MKIGTYKKITLTVELSWNNVLCYWQMWQQGTEANAEIAHIPEYLLGLAAVHLKCANTDIYVDNWVLVSNWCKRMYMYQGWTCCLDYVECQWRKFCTCFEYSVKDSSECGDVSRFVYYHHHHHLVIIIDIIIIAVVVVTVSCRFVVGLNINIKYIRWIMAQSRRRGLKY